MKLLNKEGWQKEKKESKDEKGKEAEEGIEPKSLKIDTRNPD